ncbi:STAS domain-containing protein [Streptomyces sp. NPDC046197]|uniref:STAS domain-containing protein n=1 Tax=Streptomyces sp. NPDC046197 TaxID=3154337 RepID=UPI0033F757F9
MADERDPLVTSSVHRDAFVLRVSGEIDSESAPCLVRQLDAGLCTGTVRTIVDLSGTAFADSAILHALLQAQRAHRQRGLLMVLAGPFSTGLGRLFDVTGTAGHFVLADDVHSAMEVPWAVTER